MPITLINTFSVPKDKEEQFVRWLQVENGNMTTQRGFISGKLHKTIMPASKQNFVNVVIWENEDVLWKAMSKSGGAMQLKLEQLSVEAAVDLYQVVFEY